MIERLRRACAFSKRGSRTDGMLEGSRVLVDALRFKGLECEMAGKYRLELFGILCSARPHAAYTIPQELW